MPLRGSETTDGDVLRDHADRLRRLEQMTALTGTVSVGALRIGDFVIEQDGSNLRARSLVTPFSTATILTGPQEGRAIPRCGGCGSSCTCVVEGSSCIEVTGTGQANNPLIPALRVSGDVGNSAECRGDGVYVGAEVVAGLFVGPGLTGDGTVPNPITPDPPYLRAGGTATTITNGTDLADPFDEVAADTDNMTVGVVGSASHLRCKTAGVYSFHYRAAVTLGGASSGAVSVRLAGTPSLSVLLQARSDMQYEGTAGFNAVASFDGIELDVDDEVEIRFINNMGATVTALFWEAVVLWQRPLP